MLLLAPVALAADTYVLVRDGAVLRAGQDQVTLKTSNHEPVAMRLVSSEDDVLTVEPLTNTSEHCAAPAISPSATLRVQVGRSDLETVLARSTTVTWKDGTSVRFSSGTWLQLQRDGSWVATVEGVSVPVKIGVSDLAQSYQVDASFPRWKPGGGMLRLAAPITTGGGTLTHRGTVTDLVVSDTDNGDTHRVEVVGRCLDITGDVAAKDISTAVGAIGGLAGLNATMSAPSGTSLMWLDGWPAGELTRDTKFKPMSGVRDRTCLEFVLADSKFTACMDEDAATALKR